MGPIQPETRRVLSRVESINLPYPGTELLRSFIVGALDPQSAASYVVERLSGGDSSAGDTLSSDASADAARSLVFDWIYIIESITTKSCPPPPPGPRDLLEITRRDGGKCCITGKAGTRHDPLVVLPVLPVPERWVTGENPRIPDMLDAFFSPGYRDWWFSYVKEPERTPSHHNHWLVRKSAATAFAQGFVKLQRLQSSMIEYEIQPVLVEPVDFVEVDGMYPLLGDHSRSGIKTVDARFVGSHARLSRSIRLLDIARDVAPGVYTSSAPLSRISHSAFKPAAVPVAPLSTLSPTRPFTRIFFKVWSMFPSTVRMAAYDMLRKLGSRLYGQRNVFSTERTVQKLPFGLYLKDMGELDSTRNEFNALQMVRKHTSVPVPEPLDLVVSTSREKAYLLMTQVPGVSLNRCQYVLSDGDLEAISIQMKDYLTQMRAIPNTIGSDMPICNTLGGPIVDPRVRGGVAVGPFADEAAFSQNFRYSDDPSRRGHKIVFTHADLNPRNILVEQVSGRDGAKGWRVTGIVDWATAGFYPDYWDYTKSLFEGFRWQERYNNMVHSVFKEFGDYSKELDIETKAWASGDAV